MPRGCRTAASWVRMRAASRTPGRRPQPVSESGRGSVGGHRLGSDRPSGADGAPSRRPGGRSLSTSSLARPRAQTQPSRRPLVWRVVRGGAIGVVTLLLLVVSVVVVCRAAGTDGVTPVPQLLALLPWLLVP